MRIATIILSLVLGCNLFAQNSGTIGQPGEPPDTLYLDSGADSMGLVMPTGYLLIGRSDAAPDTSAGLFWDNTNKRLGVGTTSPSNILHLVDPGASARLRVDHSSGSNSGIALLTSGTIRFSPAVYQANGSGNIDFSIYNDQLSTPGMIIDGSTNHVGFGTTSPNTSAKVEISSTTGALLIPRMTTTQRDALTAAAGMIIYNTTTGTFQGYTTSWTNL